MEGSLFFDRKEQEPGGTASMLVKLVRRDTGIGCRRGDGMNRVF